WDSPSWNPVALWHNVQDPHSRLPSSLPSLSTRGRQSSSQPETSQGLLTSLIWAHSPAGSTLTRVNLAHILLAFQAALTRVFLETELFSIEDRAGSRDHEAPLSPFPQMAHPLAEAPAHSAQLTIESMPSNVAEGKEVLLLTHNVPQNTAGFNWYKGERVASTRRIMGYVIAIPQTIPGPEYSGRETVYPNVSLLIQNVTLNDTGFYTLQVIKEDFVNEEATFQFRVYREYFPMTSGCCSQLCFPHTGFSGLGCARVPCVPPLHYILC
ncbi:hypothetical protein P7K49_034451, partial [Saguinus oedipus]